MCTIRISEIEIIPIRPSNGLVAFASFVLDGYLFVGGVGIHSSLSSAGEFRLLFPTKKLRNGRNIPLIHPIERHAGEVIQRAVVEKYKQLIGLD